MEAADLDLWSASWQPGAPTRRRRHGAAAAGREWVDWGNTTHAVHHIGPPRSRARGRGLLRYAHMRHLVSLCGVLGLLAVGCGDDAGGSANGSTTTGVAGSTTTGVAGSDTVATVDDTGPSGDDAGECDLVENDCTEVTQKCMPWSENADRIPDSTRCCPLNENPDLDGEACTVEDYDGSCVDSCEAGTMCVVDNPEGLEGLCRSFCDPGTVNCEGGDGTCKSFFELVPGSITVPLCMDKCDPLLQDCSPPGWFCIPDSPTPAGQSGFICVPPPPEQPDSLFDPCGLANDCAQGLVCVPASRVPGCDSLSCCTAYCGLSEGDAPCQDLHPDTQCVSWMSPDPTWSDVGVCALPD